MFASDFIQTKIWDIHKSEAINVHNTEHLTEIVCICIYQAHQAIGARENMSAGENNCNRDFDVRLISQIFLIAQCGVYCTVHTLLSGIHNINEHEQLFN